MQVSKWLRHSTFTLTLDVYGDYIPEEDGGALNNLPELPAPNTIGARTATNVVALFGRQWLQRWWSLAPAGLNTHVQRVARS